jgi:D-3-phosphoglycerate dehydrogenase
MTRNKVKILEPDRFSQLAVDNLSQFYDVDASGEAPCEDATVEVLFVRLAYQIDRELLALYPNLKFVVSPTTGQDHVDVEYLEQNDIRLLSLKGEFEFLATIPATAEFTWGLLLSLTRNIPSSLRHVESGGWDRDLFRGQDIFGKTISFIGYGRIAKLMTRFALAFGMKVNAYDPYVSSFPENVNGYDDVFEMLTQTDILSVNAALTDETVDLVTAAHFDSLPNHALLLNTSRGDIVNGESLLNALESNQIAAAAIDVVAGERESDSDIKKRLIDYAANSDRLLISPHLAGATYESMAMTEEFMADKLLKNSGNLAA